MYYASSAKKEKEKSAHDNNAKIKTGISFKKLSYFQELDVFKRMRKLKDF